MLEQVRELTRGTLDVLVLVAALCGLTLFAFAAISLFVATIRVAIIGRVFALPFSGNDERRVDLTYLFVRRLTEMEEEWIDLASKVESVRKELNVRARQRRDDPKQDGDTPLTSAEELVFPGQPAEELAPVAPRTTGDELLPGVVQLAGARSIDNADLGVISLAGVSFSPRDILALLRAAPGIFARRILRGSIISGSGGSIFSVEFEERRLLGRVRRRAEVREVRDEQWLLAIEDLAYRLEKERIYLVRDRRRQPLKRWLRRTVSREPRDTRSRTLGQARIEAESWASYKPFILGYAAHLRHYRDGDAADREEALEFYDEALRCQPGFPRAAYNKAVLLYNRYLPDANKEAIVGFELATESRDPTLQPLAFAGLAMVHCQAIQRFLNPISDHEPLAREAAENALALSEDLEEAVFARARIYELDELWSDAIKQYEAVLDLQSATGAALRIKSSALNNMAWILLDKLPEEQDSLSRAENLLWRAIHMYPNKIAYANLGQIGRRLGRHEDAIRLYETAIQLDPSYANGLNELAITEVELAAIYERAGDSESATTLLDAAMRRADKANRLAGPGTRFAEKLAEEFTTSLDANLARTSLVHRLLLSARNTD